MNDSVVLTGISGRFPQSDNVDDLWRSLLNGGILYTPPNNKHPEKLPFKPIRIGQLNDQSLFDSDFFGQTEQDSNDMGPQARMLFEVVYEALYDAGLDPKSLRGRKVGFFLGISGGDLGYDHYEEEKIPFMTYIFSRMSYFYDWKGPCLSMDTACASTLDALVQAHWHVKYGLCEMAIVAGLNTITDPFINMCLADLRLLSPTGYERCLDDRADGFIRSECISAIVLQRKTKAKRIYGEILGTCVNNDGYTEEGITFPNRWAQADAMRRALFDSKISPENIDYIEAHITGTQAGDAVETSAIMDAYRNQSSQPIRLGCVKSNVGHGEATAGSIAFIKACKVLQTGILTPNAGYKVPNSRISALNDGQIIPTLTRSQLNSDILGVNTFGFGGSNGHVILRRNMKSVTKLESGHDYPILINLCNRTNYGLRVMLNYLRNNISEISKDTLTLLHEVSKRSPEDGMKQRGFVILDEKHFVKCETRSLSQKSRICLAIEDSSELPDRDMLRIPFIEQAVKQSRSSLNSHGIDLMKSLFERRNSIETFKSLKQCLGIWQILLIDLIRALGIEPELVVAHPQVKSLGSFASGQENKKSLITSILKDSQDMHSKKLVNSSTSQFSSNFLQRFGNCCVHLTESVDTSSIDKNEWTVIAIGSTIRIVGEPHNGKIHLDGLNERKSLMGRNHREILLETLGWLYLSGHNPDLSLIHEFVQFPVGRECPTISSMLMWDHSSRVFGVMDYGAYFTNMTSVVYTVDLTNPEYEEVSHHLFENRVIMPAAGYIYLLWKHMHWVKYGAKTDFRQVGFRVWNVRFNRATIVRSAEDFKVSYDPSTKKFIITFQESPCVEGFGELVEKPTCNFDSYISDQYCEFDMEEIGSERLYLSCKVQGYSYGPKLRGIVSYAVDLRLVRIKYMGGLIGLMDSILQAAGLRQGRRYPRVPISMEEFIYEPQVFKETLETFQEEEPILDVYMDWDLEVLVTQGVLLKGLRRAIIPLRAEHPDLKYFHQQFKPLHYDLELRPQVHGAVEKYLFLCEKLASKEEQENSLRSELITYDEEKRYSLLSFITKLKDLRSSRNFLTDAQTLFANEKKLLYQDFAIESLINEIIKSFSNVIESDLSKKLLRTHVLGPNCAKIAELLAQSLVKWAVAIDLTEKSTPRSKSSTINNQSQNRPKSVVDLAVFCDSSLRLVPDLQMEMEKFATDIEALGDCSLVILGRTSLLSIEEAICASLKIAPVNLATRFQKMVHFAESLGFISISSCTHKSSGLKVVLLKKKLSKPEKIKLVNIGGFQCDWVEDVQEAMEDTETKRIWLVANDSYRNGILGFAKCLRFEPFGDRIRAVFYPGHSLDLNSIEMQQLFEKDMLININIDGVWGIFHQVELDLEEETYQENADCYIDTIRKGDLTSLNWVKMIKQWKNIENCSSKYEDVKVCYSALNFRDILLATGRLTADAYPPSDLETRIGTEFSGITKSGKRVMGICHGQGIASMIASDQISVLYEVPNEMSLQDAATIPNVYMTIYYALLMRGNLRKGESVLIHAGSGGVGQAAINFCLSMGCRIFTTVSTMEKKRFLQKLFPQLNDSCFADSRSIQFEEHILRVTNGRGVDVILNSLIEDKLQAGLRCLAPGGRFLELGKYDIVADNAFDPISMVDNSSFQAICLSYVISTICENTPQGNALHERFKNFMEKGLENGEIKPITCHIFSSDRVEEAFRLMAKSKHLGKVLIKIADENALDLPPPRCIRKTYFYHHKCYLIIGGLGGMGLELAYWMITRGARNIVITSRSGFKNDNERLFVEYLRNYQDRKHNIVISINDCIAKRFVNQLKGFASQIGPIGGVFNLAMVLKDGMFENQSVEWFETVCAPKVQITQNLDQVFRDSCPELDYFVCFSSISTLGSIGQTNYGYANSFMERLCEDRKREGLPALAVQWGPVADVGVAARLAEERDLVIMGFAGQNIHSCFRALDKFMQMPYAVCQSCIISSESVEVPEFENLFQRVAHILGIKDFASLDPSTTLSELGVDSLQSAEMRQYFERNYGLSIGDKPIGSLRITDLREIGKKMTAKPGVVREEKLD